ncbi:glycoside hydrolase family 13 protein [Croceivirga sp. JEA036]|uniref:glycoside hydrolase family 13 protein n=1 Tax=Croceivirga sp. JEA036 TaxID=2721162 RepID=UPI00143B3AED|nr:glycoside hydrolase family 13 protein [Croceivirga sp. JEA036]NJB37682.1 glycoside hydrolase family 13 protein [Croceivirga sp. JEA036]
MRITSFFTWILVLVLTQVTAQNSISRLEPPNWWVGMEYNTVELLVYGKDIATFDVALKPYDKVQLQSAKKVTNPNYLFITLQIDDTAKPGHLALEFKKNNSVVFEQPYELKARTNNRKNIEGFNTSDAIYLITPDRFVNGNPSNDAVSGMVEQPNRKDKGGRHGGDVQGIVNSLDAIKDMGFTAIWTNPILENNMPSYSYHGYAITDFYKVDPRYGSNEAYRAMVEKASEKGMKVIMDMIANHCGLEHWWMKDLPSDDWINQWDTYTQTNHKKTVVLDPYATKKDTKEFFDGWFVPTMPDLNQRNATMANYLIQNTLWWIEYSGIAGIRMDTYPYPDMYFMRDWTAAVMAEYPNFNIVGEEWVLRPTIVSYWQKGKENANGYTSELKSVMDFPIQHALVNSLNDTNSWNAVYEELGQDYLYPDPNNLVIFPDNHDMSRIFTQLNEDAALVKLALTYIATVRGIPQIYYGTEILMGNKGTEDHGIIRTDYPGGWAKDKVNAFTEKGLTAEQKDVKAYLSKLFNWRKNAEVIHNGKLIHFAPKDNVYVFFRYNENEKVMVILNKGEATTLNVEDYLEVLGGNLNGTEILTNKTYNNVDHIDIAAKTAMVIEVK